MLHASFKAFSISTTLLPFIRVVIVRSIGLVSVGVGCSSLGEMAAVSPDIFLPI